MHSISHIVVVVIIIICMVKTLEIHSLCKFQVHSRRLLKVFTALDIRSPELINLITESLYPLINIYPIFSNLQLLATIILLIFWTQAGNQALGLGQIEGKFVMNRNTGLQIQKGLELWHKQERILHHSEKKKVT